MRKEREASDSHPLHDQQKRNRQDQHRDVETRRSEQCVGQCETEVEAHSSGYFRALGIVEDQRAADEQVEEEDMEPLEGDRRVRPDRVQKPKQQRQSHGGSKQQFRLFTHLLLFVSAF